MQINHVKPIPFLYTVVLYLFFKFGLGPFFLKLGSNFFDGLGFNFQTCQDGVWSENDMKTPYKALLLSFPPSCSVSFLFSVLHVIFLPLLSLLLSFLDPRVLEALAPDDQWLPLPKTIKQEIDQLTRSNSSGVWRRSSKFEVLLGPIQAPLTMGYHRPLGGGFMKSYDYNAFFKIVWGPKHNFLHFSRMVWGWKPLEKPNQKN